MSAAGTYYSPGEPRGFQPGDLAVDWAGRVIYARSHEADYWYDSRSSAVGKIRRLDAAMARSGLDFFRPLLGSGNLAPLDPADVLRET